MAKLESFLGCKFVCLESNANFCPFSGPVEPGLPQGPEDGLFQLQPNAHVEHGLPDGRPQLPDRGQAHAAQPGIVDHF